MAINWNLKKKLLTSMMGSIMLGVLLIVILIVSLLVTSFPDWISSTEDAMIDAETDNLNRLSTEKSEFADVHFARVIGDLEASCVHLEDVIRGQAPIVDSIARYAAVDNPVGTVPGWRSDVDASTEVTAWYQCHPSGNRMMACDGDFNDEDAVETSRLRQTDAMELFYKGLWAADFPFQFGGFWAAVYEADGFTRLFPYLYFDEPDSNSFIQGEIECVTEGGATTTGYDGRCRGWYDLAFNAPGVSSSRPRVKFTAPYVFAGTTELGITSSYPFYNFTGSSGSPGTMFDPQGSPVGVCMLDLAMGDVGTSIEAPLSKDGYGYLIPKDGGNAVAHPDQDWMNPDETSEILELEFGSSTSSEAREFRDNILNKMEAGENGDTTFQKNGDTWHIAYRDVPSAGYSVGLVMPERDIREPFRDARSQIDATIGVQIGIIVAVLVLIASLILMYSRRVITNITEPVKLLVGLVKRINTQSFSGDDIVSITLVTDRKYLSRELAALDKIFRQMYLAIKVGQSSFLSGDLQEAENTFMDAMALFARLGHIRGLGVCHTNLGAVYAMRQCYTQAISSYEAAIQNAEEIIEHTNANGGSTPEAGSDSNAYAPSRSISKKSQLEQSNSMIETLAMRQLNLAKAITERARYSLRTHWPQRFGKVSECYGEISVVADSPVSLSQALLDLDEAVKLHQQCLKTLEKAGSRSRVIDVRCDTVNLLALYAEVIGICGQTGEARPTAKSSDIIYQAEAEFMKLMQDIQESENDDYGDDDSDEAGAQKLRAYGAQGNLLMAKNDIKSALQAYNYALISSQRVAFNHLHAVASEMKVALKRAGRHAEATKLMNALPSSARSSRKDFIFLLDNSGSMAGTLIRKAVGNMVSLYDDHVEENDRVAVYTFSTTVLCRISMRPKGSGQEAEHLRRQMASMTNAGGLTACYDSIWRGLDDFTEAGNDNRDKVIVCLTDGEDNMSRHSAEHLKQRFRSENIAKGVMLIIIAVGKLRTADTLSSVAKSSKNGQLIEARNGLQDLDEAFKQVSKIISGMSFRLEAI